MFQGFRMAARFPLCAGWGTGHAGGSMSLHPYGVLKGKVIARRHAQGSGRHYQIQVKELVGHCRVSVNISSQEYPSELEVAIVEGFHHPVTSLLAALPATFTQVPKRPGGLALDYIRANPLRPEQFSLLPKHAPGPDNDLNDKLDALVLRAANTPEAWIYAYGEPWGPLPGKYDEVFHFTPQAGLHNIHMNQGNSPLFEQDDAVWQDGALLFQFGDSAEDWTAIFLKFQSQSWHTDDRTGRRAEEPVHAAPHRQQGGRETTAPGWRLDPLVRITAAVVNGPGQPEEESVTLRNMTGQELAISGWSLTDWDKNVMPLPAMKFAPGESLEIPLEHPFYLPNRGGVLTLLDERGWKVDGVAYSREAARDEGLQVRF